MKRPAVALLLVVATGCGYPSFGFVPSDGGDPEATDAAESGADAQDGARADTSSDGHADAGDDVAADTRADAAADAADATRRDTAPETPVDTAPETSPDTAPDTAPDALDDVDTAEAPCPVGLTLCGATCVDTTTSSANCGGCGIACDPTQPCAASVCQPEPSCAAILAAFPSTASGPYFIDPDGGGPGTAFPVYCEMTADGGGWTLALKVDGAQITFAFDSALWTNDLVLNPTSTDLSPVEAKLRSFSELPVAHVRALMIDAGVSRAIALDAAGSSLRAIFAGPTVRTAVGRAGWLSLVAAPSLQPNCNDEGFDLDYAPTGTAIRVRLGIVGNEQPDCSSPDSVLGFGVSIGGFGCFGGVDPKLTTGNAAGTGCGAPSDKATKTFGMLFVR